MFVGGDYKFSMWNFIGLNIRCVFLHIQEHACSRLTHFVYSLNANVFVGEVPHKKC